MEGEWVQDPWGIHNIYRCPNGHEFIEDTNTPSPEVEGTVNCPFCGLMSIWTGNWTQDPWGIHNIFRCPNGHEFTVD